MRSRRDDDPTTASAGKAGGGVKKSAKRMFEKFTDLFLGAFTDIAKMAKKASMDFTQIRALTYYLKGVRRVRRFCLLLFSIFLATLVLVGGFILMHVAVFLYAPWSPKIKFLALFVLGAFYALVPALYLISQFSQKKWMEASKAGKFVEDVIDKG